MRAAIRSNLFVCGLSAALIAGIAGCSKYESPDEEAQVTASAPMTEAASPAAQPMQADEAVAHADASAPSAGGDADGAVDDKTQRQSIETDTRATAEQVTSSAAGYEDGKRKFIRTAQASFRVKDVYRSALGIEDAAAAQGGFVVGNDINADTINIQRRPAGNDTIIELAEYAVRGNLTVRVPSDNTQAFLRAIAGQMEFLDRRSFAAADAQFDLLRRQLAWQREQQAQQELGDAVRGGDRLDRKAEVIAARGAAKSQRDEALIQQKEFEDKVEFSTITLSLYQLPKIRRTEMVDTDAVFRKHGPGFFVRLGEALRTGWNAVLDVFLALMHAWPLWLLLAIAGVLLRRWWLGRKPVSA
jgi:Domain of unknown function (DUF4349)